MLAEDLAVLDLISGGRVELTLGIGYRLHEFAMFGVEKSSGSRFSRRRSASSRRAWTGEPFEYRG